MAFDFDAVESDKPHKPAIALAAPLGFVGGVCRFESGVIVPVEPDAIVADLKALNITQLRCLVSKELQNIAKHRDLDPTVLIASIFDCLDRIDDSFIEGQ